MKRTGRKLTQREQELVTHMRRAQTRKIPLAQYCRANGLSVQSVYNLRYRLAGKSSAHRPVILTKRRKPADKFIAVRMAPTTTPSVAACRLQMKGLVIECANLPPPAWLAGLMLGETDAVS
jgi:hypothetical protein